MKELEKSKYQKIIGDLFIAYAKGLPCLGEIPDVAVTELANICKYHRLGNILLDKINNEDTICKIKSVLGPEKNSLTENCVRYESVAIEICKVLEEIDFCFLKGFALSLTNYDEGGHRLYKDLDILVSMRDLTKVVALMQNMGFKYGRIRNGNFINAKREDVLYQKIYTHELHNMVVKYEDGFCNLDINFMFSWRGVKNEQETMREIPFSDIKKEIVKVNSTGIEMPILNNKYQFLHLCCHFYNEAVFFALNRTYSHEDPKEILLVRLLDIYLILNSELVLGDIIEIANKYRCLYKVQYTIDVLRKIDERLVDSTVIDELSLKKLQERNYYYNKQMQKVEWGIDVLDRIFRPEMKEKYLQ